MFVRKELLGDAKINITDEQPLDAVRLARAIASAKDAADDDESFMIVDLDALYERLQLWKREMPDVQPYYAVKCNSDECVLRVLAACGVNFDCASREEIDIVTRCGVAPERIIYANPCKTRSFIHHAQEMGVDLMTFDNKEELVKILKYHATPRLVLRIAVSDPTATCPLNLKFGAEPTKAAPELLKAAADLGVNVCGVSFHVGSGCNDPTAYHVALQHTKNLFELGEALGHHMEIVDMGGGFPGGAHHISFEQIAALIRSSTAELFGDDSGVKLIAEPGRFFAAHPFTLATNIIAASEVPAEKITKQASPDSAATGFMYYLNDGVYGSFNCILFDHVHPQGRPLFDAEGEELYPTTLWGPTCDSLDQIEANVAMRRLAVGDWMLHEDMGAYTCAASTTFNGFQRPKAIYVMGEALWRKMDMSI